MNLKALLAIGLFFVVSVAASNNLSKSVVFEGEWTQGGLIRGKADPNFQLTLIQNGEEIPIEIHKSGAFVFGFGRDSALSGKIKIKHDQIIEYKHFNLSKRTYKIQRINGLPPSKVDVSEKDLKRIRSEAKAIGIARKTKHDVDYFTQNFILPLQGIVTGVYGSQRILNGKPRRPHFGIDIASPTGTPIKAPASGIVTYINDDMFFSGGTIVLDHGFGLSSSFLHLSKILTKIGSTVHQGEVFAEVGATGRVTGAHLDWRSNWKNRRVDPFLMLDDSIKSTLKN